MDSYSGNINLLIDDSLINFAGPVKRVKKRYLDDPEQVIPVRTTTRWKRNRASSLHQQGSEESPAQSPSAITNGLYSCLENIIMKCLWFPANHWFTLVIAHFISYNKYTDLYGNVFWCTGKWHGFPYFNLSTSHTFK